MGNLVEKDSAGERVSKRFRVAFSFAGEKRIFVEQVARILTEQFGKPSILYDKYHEAEFARPDLAFHLPALYHDEADLVVAVVCKDYDSKLWCGLEWTAIYGLVKQRKVDEIMLARFDHAEPKGLFGLAGFVELDGKTPEEFAALIIERLAVNEGKPMMRPATPTSSLAAAALATLRDQVVGGHSVEISEQNLHLILSHSPRSLEDYRLARIAEWSQPRHAIDKRFTPLTLLVDQGEQVQGPRWQAQRQFADLRDVLAEVTEPALVVLGPPGCGKSTLLRRLELDLAIEGLRKPDEHAWVSVFLPLNSYRVLAESKLSPRAWIAQEWQRRAPGLASFDTLLGEGKLMLLLDAVNEMPHAGADDYRERIGLWRDFLVDLTRSAPGTRVVFSCRELDYSATLSTPGLRVPHVRIERLSDAQVEEFLSLYHAERGPALWQQLRGTPQLDLFRSPFYLRMLLAQDNADGATLLSGRAALFTGLVRQALIRELEADTPLLRPGPLLDRRDHEQLVRRRWRNAYDLPARGPLLNGVAKFAFDLQQRRAGAELAQVRANYDDAVAIVGGQHADELLRAAVALQVVEQQFDEVYFVHQLLQEYFAARSLVGQLATSTELARTAWRANDMNPSLDAVLQSLADSDPLPAAPTTGWEETFVLAAAMAPNADQLLDSLATVNLPLAGRCAAQPDVQIAAARRDEIRHALVARSRDPAAELRARIAAGRALGELGDPRFERRTGAHGDYLLPPMIAIPAGTYAIGSDEGIEDDESPGHPVRVAPFSLGQFPVTNAEYRCFIEARGYEEERWWGNEAARRWRRGEGTADGPKRNLREWRDWYKADPQRIGNQLREGKITSVNARQWEAQVAITDAEFEARLEQWYPPGRQTLPEYWNDPAYNLGLQPVVGVTWHEARAYCAWLSAQTGKVYRLPSEAEWEAAARGLKARAYAWGKGFDASRCNTFESHIRGTTPVGVFPGGDTPEGLVDMSGNVWDWTSSLYRLYPYRAEDGREDVENADDPRVLRGGSWSGDRDLCRCASRRRNDPDYRTGSIGFRVCCSPPII